MVLYKYYYPTDESNVSIKFTIDFNKDTYHWATGQTKEKGYQLTAKPVKREGVYEKFEAFSGFYKIIYPIGRQSKKRLQEAVSKFHADIEKYLDCFRNAGYKIDKHEENTNGQKALF